ncbi:hypothetical protein [Aureimonas sp. N4]|uniref:hypothetical protein n=1 Tax=Aureimonas sp. N4 TaxID=1638165 RepID=UPI000785EAF7|nr:hypothetical protein [Aureimonas sp. N4]
MSDETALKDIAERNGFSEGAARAMADAIRSGGGTMAQFSHPELGGMGQWSRGGMLMISAMNDHDLKARVGRLAEEIAAGGSSAGGGGGKPEGAANFTSPWAQADSLNDNRAPGDATESAPRRASNGNAGQWWPGDLGSPSSSGAQNGVRYAAFPASRRLAIEEGGKVSLYDTGDHQISGVSQSQSGGGAGSLRFTSQKGDVDLQSLTRV